jgi:Tol biopolymer transport system component
VTANGSGLDGTLGLAWTPDGRIVYVSAAGGQPDLWITSQDGRDAKAFPGNQTSRTIPSVTPDGRYIFFIGGGVDHLPHIWRMALDGGRQTQLTSGATGESTAHCCLDGKWVVHNSLGPRRLWRVPIDGGPSEPILEMTGHFPAISPDSSMIAFNSVGAQGGPSQGIGVLTVRDGNVKRFPIRNVDRTEPLLLYRPLAWTADSKGFILIRETQDISNLWVYLVDGSAPYQLTHFRDGRIYYLALSGDGKRIALARGRLSSDVVLIRNVQ